MNRQQRIASLAAVGLFAGVLAGCQAQPGPPPTVQSAGEAEPEQKVEQQVEKIQVIVSGFSPGFNPHLIADSSPLTQHVASLVLPSAFIEDTTGNRVLNSDLLTSADIFPGETFAVRYTIAPGAQWSDGTPITGTDFQYLWRQMTTQPGVVDPAGYEQISSVTVENGGKAVLVSFSTPYPAWQSLFTNLLPSHLFSSAGDFQTVLRTSVAVSGNRFAVDAIDASRGTVTLTRNDRYWGQEVAKSDRLVLQASSNAAADAELLRSGQVQAVSVRPAATTDLALRLVPGVSVHTQTMDRYLSLVFNVGEGSGTVDQQVRTRLAASIDPTVIAKVASGRTEATSPTDPAVIAGVSVAGSAAGQPGVLADLHPLRIVVDQADSTAVGAARAIADQLTTAGAQVTVYPVDVTEIYSSILPSGQADMAVVWQSGDSTPTELASHFRCSPSARTATQVPSSLRDQWKTTPSATPTPTTTAEPTRKNVARASNASGICEEDLTTNANELLAATDPARIEELRTQLLARVNELTLTIPLLQDIEVSASGTTLEAPRVDGQLPLTTTGGIFSTASAWTLNKPE